MIAYDIGQADGRYAVVEIGIVPVSRIGENDLGYDPWRTGRAKLVECDLWLGLEDDIVRHTCLGAPIGVSGPFIR
jgi:hypothetical protein